ncbi:MAG: lysophospholipid acyltransferase family protein [Akkermansia sp.]|nr:lysophospholipid acyltransferase family protein [Akkermansia sp.]
MSTPNREKITDLTKLIKGGDKLPAWLVLWAEKKLGLHALNVAHNKVEDDWDNGSTDNFFKLACKHLNLNYELSGLENIPKEGPCVIVSNHPHGMSDGLMFGDIAMKVRSDIRIVVNEFLQCVRGMVPYEIMVDVYGGEAAKRANMAGMREILRWLKAGHCILVFPSGSAATYSHKDRRVIDDPWQANIASLIRKTGATVVPMHISGRTGIFFQLISIINKGIRSNFLAREILRDGRMQHIIRLGKAITPATIAMTENDQNLSDFLRLSSMLQRYPQTASAPATTTRLMLDVEPSVPTDELLAEIEALPADCLYAETTSGLKVYAVEAPQIPKLLREIGIQREHTFRAVGEGTGNSIDLDAYDNTYTHLVMWDSKANRLAGAYRMGRTDKLLQSEGAKGIYNSLFFQFSNKILQLLTHGLEMGRAFICKEYQRHPASLDTLWMGIGHYLARHPEYRYLYGTVSISNEYTPASRALMLTYLQTLCMHEELKEETTALNPPTNIGLLSEDARLVPTALTELRLLSGLVSDLEPDGKSIPVLLRQYLRLGGRMLSFGIDDDFGSTLDCLVLVDMAKAPQRILDRYCGKDYVRPEHV